MSEELKPRPFCGCEAELIHGVGVISIFCTNEELECLGKVSRSFNDGDNVENNVTFVKNS
jgi:hypothetical protein